MRRTSKIICQLANAYFALKSQCNDVHNEQCLNQVNFLANSRRFERALVPFKSFLSTEKVLFSSDHMCIQSIKGELCKGFVVPEKVAPLQHIRNTYGECK